MKGASALARSSTDSTSADDKPPEPSSPQVRYLADNYDAVMRDAAAGGGEHLGALARLLGCADDVRLKLFIRAKEHYNRIFGGQDDEVDVEATLAELKDVLAEDPEIAARCSGLALAPHRPTRLKASLHPYWPKRLAGRRPATCHPQPL